MFPLMMQGAMNIPDCKLIWWDPWLPDQMLGSRKSSILDWDFPWNTPSSYWGTPIKMETPKSIIAVEQANMAQRIWYSTCCRRFSTPAMLRVRVLWNCVRRSMSKRWPVGPFFSWFLWLNETWLPWQPWQPPKLFVFGKLGIEIHHFSLWWFPASGLQSRWHLTHTSTRPCKGTILLVIWSLAGKLWAPCTSTRIRRRQIPCELLSRQEGDAICFHVTRWVAVTLQGHQANGKPLTNGRC